MFFKLHQGFAYACTNNSCFLFVIKLYLKQYVKLCCGTITVAMNIFISDLGPVNLNWFEEKTKSTVEDNVFVDKTELNFGNWYKNVRNTANSPLHKVEERKLFGNSAVSLSSPKCPNSNTGTNQGN